MELAEHGGAALGVDVQLMEAGSPGPLVLAPIELKRVQVPEGGRGGLEG